MTDLSRGQYYSAWTDLDFEAEGRSIGSIHVSLSTNESAYRAFRIPLVVVRNGAGPACLVTGGTHGDEWEGQIAVARLARETKPETVKGTLYIMPHANFPACQVGTRLSPLDGGNLNLTWPAPPGSGPTGQIAEFIERKLLPRVSHWIDVHTGGRTLIYAPKAAIHMSNDRSLNKRALEALAAFGSPDNLIFEVQEARSASVAAQRNGVVYVYGEFGGGSLISREGLRIADQGVRRLLAHIGVLSSPAPAPPVKQRHYTMSGQSYEETRRLYWFARTDGYFEPCVGLSEEVAAGQVVGFVHPLDGSLSAPAEVVAGAGGTVVALRAQPRVENGDCLGHLGLLNSREVLSDIWCG
jgi:predicted deacylase